MALVGYSAQRDEVVRKMADIERQLGVRSKQAKLPATAPAAEAKPKHKISAAGRRAIAEAQKKRWAESKKSAGAPAKAASKAGKPKRRLSQAGRAAIVAALKKRWAAKKALVKKAAKKAAPRKMAQVPVVKNAAAE
jgi:hypothetical protein